MNFGHKSHVKRQKALEHQDSGARLLAEIRCMESYIEGTASSDHTPHRHQYPTQGNRLIRIAHRTKLIVIMTSLQRSAIWTPLLT